MVKINPETIYALPDTELNRSGNEITPEEQGVLVESVNALIDVSLRQVFSARMQVHVGADSTYALKKEALQGLKVIHDRLINPDTKDSEKKIIALKLQERAEACTSGFHNGVNAIVDGFYLAKNTNDLMYRVRQDIVARTATQLTSEVHANNRFFVVASTSGYGVYPLNKGDIYRGNLSDKKINAALKEAFEKELRLFSVLQGLEDQLRGQLSNAGYDGAKEAGYSSDEREGIETCFELLFQDLPIARELFESKRAMNEQLQLETQIQTNAHQAMVAFVAAHPKAFSDDGKYEASTSITAFKKNQPDAFSSIGKYTKPKVGALLGETNLPPMFKAWAEISLEGLSDNDKRAFEKIQLAYQTKMTALDKQTRTRFNAAHEAFKNRFFLQNENGDVIDLNWSNIRQMLWDRVKKAGYFVLTAEEESVVDAAMNPNTSDNNVEVDCASLIMQQKTTDDLIQLFTYLHLPDTLLEKKLIEHLDPMPEGLKCDSLKKIICSPVHTEVKVNVIKKYIEQFQDTILRDKVLELSILESPETFRLLLDGMQPLSEKMKKALVGFFLKKNKSGLNTILAKQSLDPKALRPFLYGIHNLPDDLRADVLKGLLTDKVSINFGAFIMASVVYSEFIPSFSETLKNLFEKTDVSFWSSLSVFMGLSAEKNLDVRLLRRFFSLSEVSPDGDRLEAGYLCLAADMNPKSIQGLVDALQILPQFMQNNVLERMFFYRDSERGPNNAFLVAVEKNLTAIPLLMEALQKLTEPRRSRALKKIFEQIHPTKKKNFAQMFSDRFVDILKTGNDIQAIRDKLNVLPEKIRDEILKETFTRTDAEGQNLLMLVAKKKPQLLFSLLEAMSDLSQANKAEVLETVFTQTDSEGRNVFMIVTEERPLFIRPLLNLLENFLDIMRAVFQQKNQNGVNGFTMATETKESALLVLERVEPLDSTNKLKLLLSAKHRLSKLSESDPDILKATLNCIGTMTLKDQETFYKAWRISQPKLKQYGLREVSIQHFLAKIQTITEKDSEVNPEYEALKMLFEDYQKIDRSEENTRAFYQATQTLIETSSFKSKFELLPHRQSSLEKLFSFTRQTESDAEKNVQKFKAELEKFKDKDQDPPSTSSSSTPAA